LVKIRLYGWGFRAEPFKCLKPIEKFLY
jgi:hypothetical protein